MDNWLYLKLRAFAFERLGDKISRKSDPEQILTLKTPLDATPGEVSACELLLAISALREWTKPKPPPDGSEPIEPLSVEEISNLETQAAQAARSLAALSPEPQAQELRALAAKLNDLSEPQAEAPAGGVAGGDAAPPPLTTGDIAHYFAGLRWDETGWKKPLGDKPKWLEACIVIPGRRGVSETRWNPVLIAAALVQQGHASARNVRAKFQTQPQLIPWLDAWKTYEADYLDND